MVCSLPSEAAELHQFITFFDELIPAGYTAVVIKAYRDDGLTHESHPRHTSTSRSVTGSKPVDHEDASRMKAHGFGVAVGAAAFL
jgi:hypothetical protein